MSSLRKNVASQNVYFGLVNATTGAPLTGATVTTKVGKDGGAQASGAGTVTEDGSGQYHYAPTQAETNADAVGFLFTATNAVPVNMHFFTDQVDGNGLAKVDVEDFGGTAGTFASGVPAVNATKINGTTQTARDLGASVLISAGTGTGQLDVTSGVVKSNLAQILGTALTETAGQIAAAFKKVFDVASPVFDATSVKQSGDSYARLGAPVAASISADIANVLDGTNGIETGMTARQALRGIAAALLGVLSGAGTTTITIEGGGVATTRITATVDASGNRSAVTLSL